jgi:hypothetical protein
MINGTLRFMGRSFRSFVHPKRSLYGAAEAEEFKVNTTGTRFAWEFAILRR